MEEAKLAPEERKAGAFAPFLLLESCAFSSLQLQGLSSGIFFFLFGSNKEVTISIFSCKEEMSVHVECCKG
jgi:hypothetical protein